MGGLSGDTTMRIHNSDNTHPPTNTKAQTAFPNEREFANCSDDFLFYFPYPQRMTSQSHVQHSPEHRLLPTGYLTDDNIKPSDTLEKLILKDQH